jgi:integral membrane protein
VSNPIRYLRAVALAEGVSFVLLLGIAMPLKYVWGHPVAVLIAGSVHGALFLAFCHALAQTSGAARWPRRRSAGVFVAALVPFAPFAIDRRLRGWAAEFAGSAGGSAR